MPGLMVTLAHAGRSLAHRIAAQSTEARRHVDERSAAALEHARRGIGRGSRQHWRALDRCRARRRSPARASLGDHRRTIVGPVDGCLSSAGGCRVAWRARRASRHLRSLRSGCRRRIRARSIEPAVDSRSRRRVARVEGDESRPAGWRVRSGRRSIWPMWRRERVRALPFTTWFRLARVIEGSDTVALLVAGEHVARSSGGATIAMQEISAAARSPRTATKLQVVVRRRRTRAGAAARIASASCAASIIAAHAIIGR